MPESQEDPITNRTSGTAHKAAPELRGTHADTKTTKQQIEQQIGKQESRKLKAQADKHRTIWFGLGMFGIVGWSVTLPTVIGVAIGVWIDSHWPSRFSWALMLLLLGLTIGCWNAWAWINREGRSSPK